MQLSSRSVTGLNKDTRWNFLACFFTDFVEFCAVSTGLPMHRSTRWEGYDIAVTIWGHTHTQPFNGHTDRTNRITRATKVVCNFNNSAPRTGRNAGSPILSAHRTCECTSNIFQQTRARPHWPRHLRGNRARAPPRLTSNDLFFFLFHFGAIRIMMAMCHYLWDFAQHTVTKISWFFSSPSSCESRWRHC